MKTIDLSPINHSEIGIVPLKESVNQEFYKEPYDKHDWFKGHFSEDFLFESPLPFGHVNLPGLFATQSWA